MATGIKINIQSKVFKANSSKTKNHAALKQLNLDVAKGEFCSIIGPSGCGKTTLLNLISGLDNNLNGNIIFDKEKKVSDIRIAYMFPEPKASTLANSSRKCRSCIIKRTKKFK